MIEVETPFGLVEFPAGTSPEVMKGALNKFINQKKEQNFTDKKALANTGVGRTALDQGSQGATFGFGDEISSGIGAVGAKLYDKAQSFISGNEEDLAGQSISDLYNEAQNQQNANLKAQMEERPVLSIASQLAGGVPAFGIIGKVPAGAKVLDSVNKGGLAARTAKGAGLGIATGAAYGAGTAEEGNRLEGALSGATTGALVGGALPVAGAVIKTVANPSAALAKLFKIDPNAAKEFADAGVQESLAAISSSPAIKTFQSGLAKLPASSTRISNSINQSLDDIERLVGQQSTNAGSATEAGAVIQKGIEGYKNRFMGVSNKLYNRLDKFAKPDELVPIQNAANLIKATTDEFAATPNLQANILSNPAFKTLQNLVDDAAANGGNLPYSALKRYRTEIGEHLSNPTLVGKGELKQAYAALSQDMEGVFSAKGNQALNAFRNANDFYSQGMQKIDNFLQPIFSKKAPERAFQAALTGTKDGATQLNTIMRSLKPEERKIVADTVLDKMGRATAGAQNAEGSAFSVGTYLTNWNKLSPEAKKVLFGDDGRRVAIDRIAKVAERMKDIERMGGNPSGTAGQMVNYGVLGGIFYAPMSTLGTLAGGAAASRLMTNKSFINWLAKAAANQSAKGLESGVKELSKIAKNNPSIANDIARYSAILGTTIQNEVK